MTDNERELDLLIGDLQSELRQLRSALAVHRAKAERLQEVMDSIATLSTLALRDSRSEGTSQVA